MAFKISSATSGTYTWPVAVYIPIDGGKHKKETFEAIFKRHKTGEGPDPESVTSEDGVEVFKRFLVGWNGIKDDSENELPFTDENLAEFIKIPVFVVSVIDAWRASVKAAKQGN